MSRAGFALITTLWLIVVLATVVGLGLAGTRLGQKATSNRIVLTRARWAAEACWAVAQRRWIADRSRADTGSIALGRGTHCSWALRDPTARVNANSAEPAMLERLLGDSVAQVIIAARNRAPFVSDLQVLRYDSALTVEGPGTINGNAAPERVLLTIQGLGPEAVERLSTLRAAGRPITSLDGLVSAVSSAGRDPMLARYADLARQLTFSPPQLIVLARGWVGSDATLVAEIELLVVPLPERLAVIRRRMQV